jgi:hypothetical protein
MELAIHYAASGDHAYNLDLQATTIFGHHRLGQENSRLPSPSQFAVQLQRKIGHPAFTRGDQQGYEEVVGIDDQGEQ